MGYLTFPRGGYPIPCDLSHRVCYVPIPHPPHTHMVRYTPVITLPSHNYCHEQQNLTLPLDHKLVLHGRIERYVTYDRLCAIYTSRIKLTEFCKRTVALSRKTCFVNFTVADRGGGGAPPPTAQHFLNFMQCFFWKI